MQLHHKMEAGCLRHLGASTICSQLLDGDHSHGWQILATHAAMRPHEVERTGTRLTELAVDKGEGNCEGEGGGGGGGEVEVQP